MGEDAPVVISLTNTSDRPRKSCLSTFVLQNRPQLKKDGQLVPYVTDLFKVAETEEYVRRCETNAARQFYELQPKETKAIDWFSLNQGGVDWYGNLSAGRYELVLLRRETCCRGSLAESD